MAVQGPMLRRRSWSGLMNSAMQTLSRTDVRSAIITGLTTGVVTWQLIDFLIPAVPSGINPAFLVLLVPILWLLGVQLGYFLARYFAFFRRFGRFAAIGFTNAAVDFGVLFLLIGLTGLNTGFYFSFYKGISFIAASVHSYYWNKFWAFDAGASGGGAGEIAKFFAVAAVAIVVNVAVASAVVALGPLGDLTADQWAGVGAVVGSAIALIFSFLGFKIYVFHK